MKHIYLIIIRIFGLFCTSHGKYIKHSRCSDASRIKKDLKIITKTPQPRNYKNIETLNYIAKYIFDEFAKSCDTVDYQTFLVNGIEYKNVVGIIGDRNKEKIVIGAHYPYCND